MKSNDDIWQSDCFDDAWRKTKFDKRSGVFRLTQCDDLSHSGQGLWLSEVEGDLFLRCLQAYKQTLEHKEALLVDQYIATLIERLNNIQG